MVVALNLKKNEIIPLFPNPDTFFIDLKKKLGSSTITSTHVEREIQDMAGATHLRAQQVFGEGVTLQAWVKAVRTHLLYTRGYLKSPNIPQGIFSITALAIGLGALAISYLKNKAQNTPHSWA